VTCNGNWSGTFADTPITAPLAVSIEGPGDKTITIDRPCDCLKQWVVSVTVKKQGVNDDLLSVSVEKMDGTILNSVNTRTNEPVSVIAIVYD
jgi:hypothetical protein